ncbi:hypothetical protein COLO4_28179 [Corchorus olitorius]|uniref:Uncharacterized protein n=1 Tax=Corchorus olitorius TaxID=93759 RepID=A0A1R3HMT0_9ROSI|nr:hypothetical protein COLO4_28179 [Corchorus olitorius]
MGFKPASDDADLLVSLCNQPVRGHFHLECSKIKAIMATY